MTVHFVVDVGDVTVYIVFIKTGRTQTPGRPAEAPVLGENEETPEKERETHIQTKGETKMTTKCGLKENLDPMTEKQRKRWESRKAFEKSQDRLAWLEIGLWLIALIFPIMSLVELARLAGH